MSSKDRGIFQDEKASSVLFATLLVILLTITVVSGLALMISVTQKDYMDRQSVLEAQKNENLKIVTIHPSNSSADPSYWDSLNINVLNLDILDSRIAAISVNGKYPMGYSFSDDSDPYPEIYNATNKAEIPAGKSKQIHVWLYNNGFHTSEKINLSYYFNGSSYDNISLKYTPRILYPDCSYTTTCDDTLPDAYGLWSKI